MIERADGLIELICDDCGAAFPAVMEAGDRDVLLAGAQAAGWRRFRRGASPKAHLGASRPRKTLGHGRWCDGCRACVAIWAAEQRGGRLL